jgi:hypothetical protein
VEGRERSERFFAGQNGAVAPPLHHASQLAIAVSWRRAAPGSNGNRRESSCSTYAETGARDNLLAAAGSAAFSAPGGFSVKLYRIDKVARLGGAVLKKKHVLANSDNEAVRRAKDSADCPTCEVLAEDGKRVGSIV